MGAGAAWLILGLMGLMGLMGLIGPIGPIEANRTGATHLAALHRCGHTRAICCHKGAIHRVATKVRGHKSAIHLVPSTL